MIYFGKQSWLHVSAMYIVLNLTRLVLVYVEDKPVCFLSRSGKRFFNLLSDFSKTSYQPLCFQICTDLIYLQNKVVQVTVCIETKFWKCSRFPIPEPTHCEASKRGCNSIEKVMKYIYFLACHVEKLIAKKLRTKLVWCFMAVQQGTCTTWASLGHFQIQTRADTQVLFWHFNYYNLSDAGMPKSTEISSPLSSPFSKLGFKYIILCMLQVF